MATVPILFLDYDGVLHPDDVYRINGQIVLKRDGFSLFEWSPLLLEALVPHSDVRIVLSTSWVRVIGYDKARKCLPRELQERVIGATWHSQLNQDWWSSISRYEQIAGYTRRHTVTRWLAIDDEVTIWGEEHLDQLIETDSMLGLAQPEKLDELKRKLQLLTGA